MTEVVLDAGALIGLERRSGRLLAILDELVRTAARAHVPAGVVAQAWRGSVRQHAVAKLLRSDAVRVDPLSQELAFRLGVLLGASQTSDVTDAHVAYLARALRATVVTSDPDDLRRIDPDLPMIIV